MTEAIIAATIWALVAALLLTVRGRVDQSVLYASATIAISLLFNIDSLYLLIDSWLGGRNILDLVSNVLLVVGIYFLSRTVLRALNGPSYSSNTLRLGLGLVLILLVALFAFIDAPRSSTTFMLDYGGQVPAALYSIIEFAYVGVTMWITAAACIRHRRSMQSFAFRAGLAVIAAGCISMLGLVTVILTLDVLHVLDLPGMKEVGLLYSPLYVLSMVLLCTGLAFAPITRFARRITRRRRLSALSAGLVEILERRPRGVNLGDLSKDEDGRLHRLIIMVRDEIEASPTHTLGDAERATLSRAEAFLTEEENPSAQATV